MSAIAGIYYLDGQPVDCADLGRMVDTLAHRGPDDSATKLLVARSRTRTATKL
jgi:asparagine synthetase B (glutamine-hydrolysing)